MEKQKKLKFNLVDVIFILVVLAGIAFVALRMGGVDVEPSSGSSEEYIITFVGTEVPNYVIDRLEVGAPVTDDSLTVNLGTLVDFETGPAKISSAAADGHQVVSDREGYSSLYLICRVSGTNNGFGVTVDGLKLGVGHSIVVRARDAKLWMAVYDIQKLSDSPYAGQ